MSRIRRIIDIFIRWIHGHTLNCCSDRRQRCKNCPFNTDEVREIVREHKKKEEKGYFTINTGGKK